MSIFGAIMDKIFHHDAAPAAAPSAPPAAPSADAPAETPPAEAAAPAPAPEPVDVEAVLTLMACDKDFDGNWRTSIVDLLKLLDLDASLDARKSLADELNVHEGEAGTAEENMALHTAVMAKLAENGGKVPDSLKGA